MLLQVTIDTTQALGPCLDGTIFALVMASILCVGYTLAFPEKDDSAWDRCGHDISYMYST